MGRVIGEQPSGIGERQLQAAHRFTSFGVIGWLRLTPLR